MESFVEVECADDGIDSMTCQSQCTHACFLMSMIISVTP